MCWPIPHRRGFDAPARPSTPHAFPAKFKLCQAGKYAAAAAAADTPTAPVIQ
jgi:hypothetical protein